MLEALQQIQQQPASTAGQFGADNRMLTEMIDDEIKKTLEAADASFAEL